MPEQFLRSAEQSAEKAGKKRDSADGAVDEARSLEGEKYYTYQDKGNGSFEEVEHIRSNVTGRASGENAQGKFKTGLKKKGPLIGIIALLGVFATLIFMAQSLMPFAVVNRIIEEFNTNGISSVLRADNILDYQMSTQDEVFALTQFQRDSLKENNILPMDFGGGTVLAYKISYSGDSWKVVHGTVPASPSITDIQSQYKSLYSGFNFNTMSLVSIEEAMGDGDFKKPYTTASKTWRGGNSGWYDTLTSLNESIRGLERSRFFALAADRLNAVTTVAARNIMKGRTITDFAAQDTSKETELIPVQHQDESGRITHTTMEPVDTTTTSRTGINKAAILSSVAKGVSKASTLAQGYCMYVEIANKIQTIVHSVATVQQMNLITGYAEAVQKVQIGDNTGTTAMHEYANNLVEKDTNGKSAIESAGFGAMFSGDAIDPNDESVKTATAEGAFANLSNSSNPVSNIIASAVGEAGSFMNAMTRCTYIKGSLSIVSTIMTVASVATGGLGALFELGIQTIIGLAASWAIQQFASALINWFWDSYGATLEADLATAVFGEDLGNAMTSGANKYLSSNHQVGGGSPATQAAFIGFRRQQEVVLAEEAEYQRSIRSPFDLGSQYTFLGSIVYNLIPMANTSGVSSVVRTMGGLVRSSVTNLLPSASAIAETNLISSIGNCPTLESIGIVGDAYCNPYFVSDTSTNTSVAMLKKLGEFNTLAANGGIQWQSTGNNHNLTPSEIIDIVYGLGGLEQKTPTTFTDRSGNQQTGYKIKENSNLYKYARYCGTRTSDWGFADANIAQELNEEHSNNWWNRIPIIGDLFTAVANMIEAGRDKEWISGAYCVAREYQPSCDVCDKSIDCFWQNEGRFYQRFIEDQRYYISAGTDSITSDSVSLLLNDYYEEHPLDNSFEGILARYSGMTKDDVVATLDLIEGLNYIANYHPENRYAFVETEEFKIYYEETESTDGAIIATEPKYIIYDTVRNRAKVC